MKKSNNTPNDIQVQRFLKCINSGDRFVQLSFEIPGKKSPTKIIIPMSIVNTNDIVDYLPAGYVMKFPSKKEQAIYMRSVISQSQTDDVAYHTMLLPGYNQVGNSLLYVLGGTILGNRMLKNYFAHNPDLLKVDKELIESTKSSELAEWIDKWSEHSHLSALLLTALSPFTYPIVQELSPKSESLNAFIVGKTGSGKTSYASILTDIFQENGLSYSLLAPTKDFFDLVRNRSHVPILIDDLSSSASANHNQKQVEKLTQLIMGKSAAGGVSKGVSAEHLKKISLLITAESSVKAPSTMNRCLVIKFPERFDQQHLTDMQAHNLFPVLVVHLIRWICYNQDTILKRISSKLLEKKQIEIPHQNIWCSGGARIEMTFKSLLLVQMVLLDYLEHGLRISSEKILSLEKNFTIGISEAIRHTKEASREIDDDSILPIFLDLFKYNPDGIIAYTPEAFFDDDDNDEKIIFHYDKKYFFRGEAMHAYLKQHFVDISSKKLSSILKNAGLLCTRDKELSYKLPKKLRKQFDLGDTRYYSVYSNVLDSLVADRCDNIIELFGSHLYKYQ